MWLITRLFKNCGDSHDVRDGLAIDLEDGFEKPVFNLPTQNYGESSILLDPTRIGWRRLL